jgi:2-haloalkanoic acid dehalogenase type II
MATGLKPVAPTTANVHFKIGSSPFATIVWAAGHVTMPNHKTWPRPPTAGPDRPALTIWEDPMPHVMWDHVTRDDVVRAIQEYDRLGPGGFFSEHGFGPTTTYDLVWDERPYPPKAILGTAYELATGQRLAPGDFEGGKTGGAVLRMLAAARGITISDADGAELTDRFATMPPHPEVPAALRRLREHGFRLFTLTDNTLEISGRQLERAGVIDVFERRFSVDETVRRHKPAPEAYHSVAAALGADPGDICLIASHVWDTIGALAAGWQAALILREGNAPLGVGPQPDYIGKDLEAIADQLIERYVPAANVS